MNILILNWRDIRNPAAGGAEILTHEIAKRWSQKGNSVTIFSAQFLGCKKEEIIDGIRIVRRGNWWNVRFFAPFFYFKNSKNIDIVIDEVHWFPFFSIFYAPQKTVLLACEVADKLFSYILPVPLDLLGRLAEKIYLFFYRNVPTMAISPSTKDDLIKEGFRPQNIIVIPMGLTIPPGTRQYDKEKATTIIFLGRINKQKGIEDALAAFQIIKKENIADKLWVVGSGKEEYMKEIKKRVDMIGLSSSVIFFGFVSEEDKFKLLSKAHVLVVPSIHEGWGLIVPEAGYVGTPAVVYNSKGLCDIIKTGENGFLVDSNPQGLVSGIKKTLENKKKYLSIQKNAINMAQSYDWDKTANIGLNFLEKVKHENL